MASSCPAKGIQLKEDRHVGSQRLTATAATSRAAIPAGRAQPLYAERAATPCRRGSARPAVLRLPIPRGVHPLLEEIRHLQRARLPQRVLVVHACRRHHRVHAQRHRKRRGSAQLSAGTVGPGHVRPLDCPSHPATARHEQIRLVALRLLRPINSSHHHLLHHGNHVDRFATEIQPQLPRRLIRHVQCERLRHIQRHNPGISLQLPRLQRNHAIRHHTGDLLYHRPRAEHHLYRVHGNGAQARRRTF